jgi:hypothetical protein
LAYTVVSHVPDPSAAQLAASGWADMQWADLQKYLALPPGVPAAVRLLATEHTRGAQDPYQAALMLQDWLRSPPFTYRLDVPADESADALAHFLTKSQAGFCQQFAAAFAVLGREIGLPTRVTVGFTPGDRDSHGLYHVTNADAHAWPEVWFNGIGWYPSEPTPGHGSPDPGAEAVPHVQPPPSERAAPPTAPAASTAAPRPRATPASGNVAAGPAGTRAASGRRSGVPVVLITASIVGAAVAWAVGLAVLTWAAGRRRRRNARSPAAKVTLAWSFASEALARAGLPPRPWESPTEFSDRVGRSSFPAKAAAAVATLAELEERAAYSAGGPAEGDVEAADAAAEKVLRAARVGGRRKSLLRVFDPRSVVTSVPGVRAEARGAGAADRVGPSA